jgi:Mg2+ and Co2+ transporter CorA
MEKKTYVFIAGKHHTVDANGEPKVYHKGDKIELTEKEAAGLTNKIVDPQAEYGVEISSGPSVNEGNAMLQRIAELEAENTSLREAVDADDDE